MPGIFERISALAETEWANAANFAHEHFQSRMGVHNHVGRSLVETVAELCRSHPNLIGIAAGLAVQQLLVEEKKRYDAHREAAAHPAPRAAPRDAPRAAPERTAALVALNGEAWRPEAADAEAVDDLDGQEAEPPPRDPHDPFFPHFSMPHPAIRLASLRPGRVAMEVFAALLLLKLAATGARMFRRRGQVGRQDEVWFAPAARIRLFSGTIASYYFIKSLRSPRLSAWRNAAIMLFGTDAVKPVLRPPRQRTA